MIFHGVQSLKRKLRAISRPVRNDLTETTEDRGRRPLLTQIMHARMRIIAATFLESMQIEKDNDHASVASIVRRLQRSYYSTEREREKGRNHGRFKIVLNKQPEWLRNDSSIARMRIKIEPWKRNTCLLRNHEFLSRLPSKNFSLFHCP